MDTSETYIKMCEKAEEIQGTKSDYYERKELSSYAKGVHCIVHRNPEYSDYYHIGDSINKGIEYAVEIVWLPRQDQLQGMLNDNINQVVKQQGIDNCLHFVDITQMLSMSWEQLWLCLVMLTKYNKTWDGSDWISG